VIRQLQAGPDPSGGGEHVRLGAWGKPLPSRPPAPAAKVSPHRGSDRGDEDLALEDIPRPVWSPPPELPSPPPASRAVVRPSVPSTATGRPAARVVKCSRKQSVLELLRARGYTWTRTGKHKIFKRGLVLPDDSMRFQILTYAVSPSDCRHERNEIRAIKRQDKDARDMGALYAVDLEGRQYPIDGEGLETEESEGSDG
jgi:hypothetical protein